MLAKRKVLVPKIDPESQPAPVPGEVQMPERSSLRVSLVGEDLLRFLIEIDAFRVCQPLDTNKFVDLAKGSGLSVDIDLLEQFEKRGLFYPLLRVRFPVYKTKIRRREDGRVEECGTLQSDEDWQGPIHESYVWPNFSDHKLSDWMDHGYLYSPETLIFQPWDSFRDECRRQSVTSYYSPFQLYSLAIQLNATDIRLNAANLADYSDEDFEKLKGRLKEKAAWKSDPGAWMDDLRFDAVIVAQAISSRYYPGASGDRRTMTIPGGDGRWDWYKYARNWRPNEVVERLGISVPDVRRYCEMIDTSILFKDPLEDWDDLLSFVHLARREKLKGGAQFGQTLRVMRNMLKSLVKDLTGESVEPRKGTLAERYSLNEGTRFARAAALRQKRAGSEVDFLEFVANRYGLNPQPALVLFVEGDGEVEAIPLLVERLFGVSFPVVGIEIRNLHGIAGFLGSKRDRYSALEKVIEELHFKQTIAFVVVDNEWHGIHKLRRGLSNKKSLYVPERTVIRSEFIHVWQRRIELDNFEPCEIAAALTLTCEGHFNFTAPEVEEAASRFGREPDPLSQLFKEKTEHGLPKPKLLGHLFDQLEPGAAATSARSLVILLNNIIQIAALNHKPTFVDTWFENQESGYLGHPTKGPDKMASKFRELHQIQEHLKSPPKERKK